MGAEGSIPEESSIPQSAESNRCNTCFVLLLGATQYSREDELRLWRVGELLLAKQSDRIITNKPPLAHLVKRGLKKAMQHFF